MNPKPIKKSKKKRHVAVVAIIFNEKGHVLLTQRNDKKSPYSHGKWQFPGGGIEQGEHPHQTAIREVQEETGLTIEIVSKHPFVYSHHFETANVHVIVLGYIASYLSGEIDISRDAHTGDARWFKTDEIDFSLCLPLTQELIQDALTAKEGPLINGVSA